MGRRRSAASRLANWKVTRKGCHDLASRAYRGPPVRPDARRRTATAGRRAPRPTRERSEQAPGPRDAIAEAGAAAVRRRPCPGRQEQPWGWVVGVADELLWIVYAIATRQWAFIVSATVYIAVCARNLGQVREQAGRGASDWTSCPARQPHRPVMESRSNRGTRSAPGLGLPRAPNPALGSRSIGRFVVPHTQSAACRLRYATLARRKGGATLMAPKRPKMRTVAFYEVVGQDGARMEGVGWGELLGNLGTAPLVARRFQSAIRDLVGSVYTHRETDTLLLSSVRDVGELPQRLSFTDGTIEEFEVAAGEGVIETSNAVFYPRNVVGLMRGSTSAPTTTALEDWVNGLRLLTTEVEIRPLVRHSALTKLRNTQEARSIRIKVNSSAADALESTAPRLASMTREARRRFGDVIVEMIIQVPRGGTHDREGSAILAEGLGLVEARPYLAKAQMRYLDPYLEKVQQIDFLRDRLATKMAVELRDEGGRPVRNSSAVDAIMEAYAKLRDELALAVGQG